jgi:hypothetical protein
MRITHLTYFVKEFRAQKFGFRSGIFWGFFGIYWDQYRILRDETPDKKGSFEPFHNLACAKPQRR